MDRLISNRYGFLRVSMVNYGCGKNRRKETLRTVTIYISHGLYAKDVRKKDKHLIEWLQYIHDLNTTIIDPDDVEMVKKGGGIEAFMCSGFGDPAKPKQPDSAPREVNRQNPPVRDYVVIDYDDFTDKTIADELPGRVKASFGEFDYAVYPSISYPAKPRWRLVVMLHDHVSETHYKYIVQHVIDTIGFADGDDSNKQITHLMNAPRYSSQEGRDKAVFQITGKRFDASDIMDEVDEQLAQNSSKTSKKGSKKAKNENNDQSTPLEEDILRNALDDFLASDEIKQELAEYTFFWKFAESVAYAQMKDTISREFAETIMHEVAYGNPDWEKNNIEELDNQIRKLNGDFKRQSLVKPITAYLPIVAQYTDVYNLAQLFDAMLPGAYEPDPQMHASDVAETITRFFEFALLPTRGRSDAESIAVFNPLTGAWEHDEDEFISMMTVIKPGITHNQVKTVLMQWGAIARRNDAVIDPYNQTGFLLFKNGALNIDTLKLHNFNDPVVRENQFTKRHKINMNWSSDPYLKVFKNDRPDGGDWTIDDFIGGYAYNDPELIEFFLFGLSLGLFAGHNTSVHFDIQGKSRLGKTTLSAIFDNLFDGRVAITTYNQLNQPFPLTSYDLDTAIIWVKENNIGAPPLNDEFGTPFYDGMADNQMRLPVKHGGDIIVDNPPQLFIDGTQFIQATEIHTGPAGRTLAFKLPDVTEEERDKFYSNDIFAKFKDEEVMQYLVAQMISAFKSIVPENRQANFKMNLASTRDIELIPEQAREWRHEFVNADINIKSWFDEEILPFLIPDKPLHKEVLHELYKENVRRKSSDNSARFAQQIERFWKNLEPLLLENNFEIEYVGSKDKRYPTSQPRKKIDTIKQVGFDWDGYEEGSIIPEALVNVNNMPGLFGKKRPGWFELKK